MFFVTPVLFILSIVFYIWGEKAHSKETKYLGMCFLLGALGTGVVEFLAMAALG